MISKRKPSFATRMQAAVDELRNTILQPFPDASFRIERARENPKAVHLIVTVDREEPWDVLDAVIDRVVDLQVDHGLPVHVIPVHTPERMAALRREGALQRARGEVPVA